MQNLPGKPDVGSADISKLRCCPFASPDQLFSIASERTTQPAKGFQYPDSIQRKQYKDAPEKSLRSFEI
jgi:hypothetical protein